MSIEISCPQCFANLRVPDEAAGAQAKCPHCSEVFVVHDLEDTLPGSPAASTEPETEDMASVASPFADPSASSQESPRSRSPGDGFSDPNNPYASPTGEITAETESIDIAPLGLGRLDAGMSLSLAWEQFFANLPLLLMTHTTAFVISITISLVAETFKENGQQGVYAAFVGVSYPIQWFLLIGLTTISLGIARGRRMEFNDLFRGAPLFLRVSVYTLLYMLMVLMGTFLLVVPGIYLAMRFWPGVHFIIDRDVTVMEAFELSSRHMQGNYGQLIILGGLGMFVLCAGLFVFSYGMYTMLWTIAFMMITRQPIQRSGTSQA